jgi:hypothetical protein
MIKVRGSNIVIQTFQSDIMRADITSEFRALVSLSEHHPLSVKYTP